MKLQNKVRELSEKKSNIMKSNKILTNQISVVSEKCDVCEAEYKRTLNERNLVKRQQTATLLVEQQRYRNLSKKVALVANIPYTFSQSIIQPTAAEAAPVSVSPGESHWGAEEGEEGG